jgi:hypothetical protein
MKVRRETKKVRYTLPHSHANTHVHNFKTYYRTYLGVHSRQPSTVVASILQYGESIEQKCAAQVGSEMEYIKAICLEHLWRARTLHTLLQYVPRIVTSRTYNCRNPAALGLLLVI